MSETARTTNLFDLALDREFRDPEFRAGFERKLAKITAVVRPLVIAGKPRT